MVANTTEDLTKREYLSALFRRVEIAKYEHLSAIGVWFDSHIIMEGESYRLSQNIYIDSEINSSLLILSLK